jgi:imidazolonepropionase-like amidohydrolase
MRGAANDLALVGGAIWPAPAEASIPDGVVLVRDRKICAVGHRASIRVPKGTKTIDCFGCTIVAGFWNSHVHFFERKWANAESIPGDELGRQLQDMLTRYGFTSVFDLSSRWENTRRIRDRIASGEVQGPTILSTGEGLVPPGAVPSDQVLGVMGVMTTPLPEIADAAQARVAARKLLQEGVDGIKLFASTPRGAPLAEGAIQAAVEEARGSGKPVFVHPNTGADVLAALSAGVDVIAHTTPRSGPWDEAILALVKQRRAALTPTLSLWKYFLRHDRVSTQEQLVDTAVGQLLAWIAAGGEVLFGTDLGAVDPDPSVEHVLMARAGMTFPQILASLTTAPAERFGVSATVGRIAPGLQADLVVLDDDPTRDIRAFCEVRCTVRAGQIVHSARP